MESGLAVAVLEVDLELRPGEEILVDPGLAVPKHKERYGLKIYHFFIIRVSDFSDQKREAK